ncbi:MAG: hypothetical protein ACOC56_06895, partial [Atribacterota bacterium]
MRIIQERADLLQEYFSLKEKDALKISKCLLGKRYLSDIFLYDPDRIIEDIKDSSNDSLLYFPCDLVQLRYILKYGIPDKEHVLFKLTFAQNYLNEYP